MIFVKKKKLKNISDIFELCKFKCIQGMWKFVFFLLVAPHDMSRVIQPFLKLV